MSADELEGSDFTVIEGRDGRLFLETADGVDLLRSYSDPEYVADDLVQRWRQVMRTRAQFFDELGIAHLTVVVPDCCKIYPESVPDGLGPLDQSPFQAMAAGLDEKVRQRTLLLTDALLAAREVRSTFKHTDSHWTDWGSFVGYRETMNRLTVDLQQIRVVSEAELLWSERQYFGAMGVMMPTERSEVIETAEVVGSRTAVTQYVVNDVRDNMVTVEQDRPDLPTAIIFRDSTVSNAHQYFSESFRRTIYCAYPNAILYDLVEKERPDVVIVMTGERRFCLVPNDSMGQGYRNMFGDLMIDDKEAVAAQIRSRSKLRTDDAAGALADSDEVVSRAVNARILLHRAKCLELTGNPSAAVECLRAATLADPTDGPIHVHFARLMERLGRHDEAVKSYIAAAEVEPRAPELWIVAIRALVAARRLDEAVRMARRAVERHPHHAPIRFACGYALAEVGSIAPALDELLVAKDLDPDSIEIRRRLAAVLFKAGDMERARIELESLIADHPDESEAKVWLDRALNRLKAAE